MRMTSDFLEELDILCSIMAVKRVDFIKYSIVEFGLLLEKFSFKSGSFRVRCYDRGEEYVDLMMNESWRASVSEEVGSNIKSRSKHQLSGSNNP